MSSSSSMDCQGGIKKEGWYRREWYRSELPVYAQAYSSVEFLMEGLKIYGEMTFSAGTIEVTNTKDQDDLMDVCINYIDEKTHKFHLEDSIDDVVIESALPFIADGRTISFLDSRRRQLEWDTPFTTKTPVTASAKVLVPAKSTVILDYVGTKGTCALSFKNSFKRSVLRFSSSNTIRRDTIKLNPPMYEGVSCYDTINLNPPMYEGVSCYDFQFLVKSVEPIIDDILDFQHVLKLGDMDAKAAGGDGDVLDSGKSLPV